MIPVTVAITKVDYYPHLDIDPMGSFLLAGRRASRLAAFPRSDTLPSRGLLLRNVGGESAIRRKCDLAQPDLLVIERHHIAGHHIGRQWVGEAAVPLRRGDGNNLMIPRGTM
jgi:hypothetical protein